MAVNPILTKHELEHSLAKFQGGAGVMGVGSGPTTTASWAKEAAAQVRQDMLLSQANANIPNAGVTYKPQQYSSNPPGEFKAVEPDLGAMVADQRTIETVLNESIDKHQKLIDGYKVQKEKLGGAVNLTIAELRELIGP